MSSRSVEAHIDAFGPLVPLPRHPSHSGLLAPREIRGLGAVVLDVVHLPVPQVGAHQLPRTVSQRPVSLMLEGQ